jgi:hypothetical protein
MINFLQNFQGKQNTFENSAERNELSELRKEMNKYKKKYISSGGAVDSEGIVQSNESEHDEDDDEVDSLIEQKKQKIKGKGGRSSVSAEVYGTYNAKKLFVPKVITKTEDQIRRIQDKVLKSFIFNMLDEKELKIVIDAMEEYCCKPGDYVIKEGDPGAVLYIIEKGEYDCYKQFVSTFF